ncbi:MAG: 16S rRNA (guanine(527)-N(7))-methyltransferase RsmG [Rhodospirillaceae bacterium]|jgi:16S rRNA (guanine527-N7)-methyltransferase|nr:16S rRNA (guanine(527)-N(7))-methyltransferase RsmG [Rhodospirillaceae bacterium]MBT3926075.1 16S rRNA (guanine(527)-N(7))-methyltransferase RsmG [Rhodospirillaceae bacterium]MBT4426313.1 16S rRNA (guanine(527)-N(7))-methyltransferase RsmG [Rhodospirillaceae bacterium]MBT5038288.1 16S rRNA (guanine(527)-N(7))-methyltransferase RsmG [Rhodospirillaceae bacterium]MBT5677026.1 16S rRNA (guanine(527)-N(7))-methyltransferase RsmG [Rhodospirillaceae bacterium]
MAGYGSEDFARDANVSRETCERLELYAELLKQWNPRINLVSRDSLRDLWRRHFVDSAQLHEMIPDYDGALVDLGSGAGFPGLVLAIMGLANVHLIEANLRKCTFLREVARRTDSMVTVHNIRLGDEADPGQKLPKAEIITARAVSQLVNVLDIAYPLMYDRTCCIFHKGSRVDEELNIAREQWRFELERIASISDPSGTILRLRNIRRLGGVEVED